MSDSNPVPSKIIPNTFQTPNLLTDDGLLALLTGNETKCYLVVIRKTFGWRKDRDRIAKSQIMSITGIGENGVDDAMSSLVRYGLIVITAENDSLTNKGNEWAPQMDDSRVDYNGLRNRQADAKEANLKRTSKARKAQAIRRGGDVQHPQGAEHPRGGDVGHPPQQPNTANLIVGVNAGDVIRLFEQEIGVLTPLIINAIKDACETYPVDWIPEAISIAARANHRSWNYVEGILRNCKAKNVRPSLNKLEKKRDGKHHASNSKRTKQSEYANSGTTVEYSQADLDAAAAINARLS